MSARRPPLGLLLALLVPLAPGPLAAQGSGKIHDVARPDALKPVRTVTSEPRFDRPHNVVLSPDGKHLVVNDMGADLIRVLDPDTLAIQASFGEGVLDGPHDADFDHRGRLLIADTANNRIAIYRFNGVIEGRAMVEPVAELTDRIDWPEGVAATPDGRLYVTNVGSGSLVMLKGGKVIKEIDGSAAGGIGFSRPHDVEYDARAGRVIVADSGNNRVVVYDRDLNLVANLAGAPYHFDEPEYLATTPDGLLWVADEYNSQIKILDAAYKPVGFIGTGEKGDGPGQLNWPEGIFVKGAEIWISDTYNDRILKYRRPAP